MIENKIYQNFLLQILKNFFFFLFIFSTIALTVRAVNFLDLIVDSGYPVTTYFAYSALNFFGLMPKFITLSFLISLMIFIIKHNDSEFVILWTAGVNKLKIINIMLFSSVIVLFFYIVFSAFLSPVALNKSRQLLSNDKFNSFLPTVKSQQFTDNFKGLTIIIDKKKDNEIENVFLHDTSNNLKNLTSNSENTVSTTVIAKKGIADKRRLSLIDGQIISNKKDNEKNELISFSLLDIDLTNLVTNTIKQPKLQETSTIKILNCLLMKEKENKFCNKNSKKEVVPNFFRRIILPFYIPSIVLICSLLLLKNKKFYFNYYLIFFYSLTLIIFTELFLRYTGISMVVKFFYIFFPFILFLILYLVFVFILSNKAK